MVIELWHGDRVMVWYGMAIELWYGDRVMVIELWYGDRVMVIELWYGMVIELWNGDRVMAWRKSYGMAFLIKDSFYILNDILYQHQKYPQIRKCPRPCMPDGS